MLGFCVKEYFGATMNKNPKNNKSHSQGEIKFSPEEIRMLQYFLTNQKSENNEALFYDDTQLSPEEIRMLRHFLKDYVMKAKTPETDEPHPPEEEPELSTKEMLVLLAVVLISAIIGMVLGAVIF